MSRLKKYSPIFWYTVFKLPCQRTLDFPKSEYISFNSVFKYWRHKQVLTTHVGFFTNKVPDSPKKKKKKKQKKKTNQKKYFLGQRGQLSTIPYNVQVKNKLSGNVTKDI